MPHTYTTCSIYRKLTKQFYLIVYQLMPGRNIYKCTFAQQLLYFKKNTASLRSLKTKEIVFSSWVIVCISLYLCCVVVEIQDSEVSCVWSIFERCFVIKGLWQRSAYKIIMCTLYNCLVITDDFSTNIGRSFCRKVYSINNLFIIQGCRGRGRIVVGFTITYVISAYHH